MASTAAAAAAAASKPSKWFSKLCLHRPKLRPPTPHTSPPPPTNTNTTTTTSSSNGGGDKVQGFQEVFRLFDANGDGKISGEELRSFFASAGEDVSAEDVEGAIGDLDSDGDGLMNYGDFVRLMERDGGGGGCDEDLRRAFEMFELEKGAGCITPGGLRRALGRLGELRSDDECAAMIRAYDVDGNGVLDYQEFRRMMS